MKRALKPFTNENIVVCEFHLTKTISYKQMNKRCNLLLTLLIFLFCCVLELYAQEQTPPGFTIGTFVGGAGDQDIYASFDSSGMNTLVHYAHTVTKPYLTDYSVIARNDSNQQQWINHYATSLYSKWEAEENQTDTTTVGVKHKFGKLGEWLGEQCWSTIDVTSPADLLVYGPDYRQEKEYQRWLYNSDTTSPNYRRIFYTVRYRMALDTTLSVNPNEEVCRITVRVRHSEIVNGTWTGKTPTDTLAGPITLKVSDFPANESFNDFLLEDYTYLPQYPDNPFEDKIQLPSPENDTTYSDSDPMNGVQFCVEWLRDDTLCTLYIDRIEVYDNYGWNDEILTPGIVESRITQYLSNYPTSEWPNIKYWWSQDEPYSIDAYTPMRVVDSLVRSVGGAPLITEFYPNFRVLVNGDSQLVRYYNMVDPEKLMIDFYPFSKDFYPIRVVDLDTTRNLFQIAHSLQPGFWYVGQGFGARDAVTHEWCSWRRPDSSELKATVMLALAHGVKGLMFWNYESYNTGVCGDPGYFDCIVGKAPNYDPSELWYLINENFVPRLKGKLGNTLLTLDYTGNFLQLQYSSPTQNPTPDPVVYDYLTLYYCGTVLDDMNWHAGFFTKQGQTDNKHFLLANLRTNESVEAKLIVSNNIEYENVSFTDIEGGSSRIDTTIGYNSSVTYCDTMPAGEGRLYRVAPVARYGGRLIYDEEILRSATLYDEMTIENGARLSISADYHCYANIIIKDGEIIRSGNGKLIFHNGFKLIVEGTATVNGTSEDKLTLEFESVGPETENGIVIDPEGSLTISNCRIEGAETGIKAELYAKYLNAQYVDFIDCITSSVTILGQMGGGETPPPHVKYCTISNSEYGISVSNLSTITIQQNTITNTELGIFLSNVTSAIVYVNTITSNKESMPGILYESSGGDIVANTITGHTNGIHLGNSSPDIGDNEITNNKYHGIYIGSGSYPNMRGELAGNPPLMYPISGYNWIYDNGGYIVFGAPPDNDGSEIYFYYSDALMREGCNSIIDDRTPGGGLVNTLLLMNGDGNEPMEIHAELNFWGDTVYAARFGALTVYFNPYYYDHCPTPQGGGGEEGLVMKNVGGEVIDTIYSVPANIPQLTEIELKYSEAEEYFVTADYPSAEVLYQEIINSQATEEEKYKAQIRKYEIGRLTNQSIEFFNTMGNTFESIGANSLDSLAKKIFSQLATLCLIGEEEYIPAISEFDVIVQQNPGSEESVYAEIDALTAALLLPPDSTLGKGSLGKYLIKNSRDYFSKIDGILRKNFGSEKETAEKEILPEEYILYQNYPNPFNPVTTIKYDLPKASEVELVVYDILGRKVKTLVNQTQQAGRYEMQFNASTLASGVYIYQLRTKDFVNSKKMILLK